jgi:hypothetical protein
MKLGKTVRNRTLTMLGPASPAKIVHGSSELENAVRKNNVRRVASALLDRSTTEKPLPTQQSLK